MRSKWYDPVIKQTLMGGTVIVIVFVLFGCSPLSLYGKDGNTIRAALDECRQNQLDVLLFQRPDQQVYAIRCLPPASEVTKTVTVRQKTPINVLRPFFESKNMLIEQLD